MRGRAPHIVLLPAIVAVQMFAVQARGQQAPGRALQIVVVEGEGAINNVRSRVNREPIVRVEDENHKPVAGAAVIFFLPNQGPGGTFLNGTSSLTTTSDARGRAVSRGAQFNQQAGPMQIRVAASYAGQTASAVINQSNVVGPVVSGGGRSGGAGGGGGLSTTAKILIIAGVAAAGATGAIVATRGGGSSPTTPPPTGPTATFSAGTITVGAPPSH